MLHTNGRIVENGHNDAKLQLYRGLYIIHYLATTLYVSAETKCQGLRAFPLISADGGLVLERQSPNRIA